MEYLIGGGVGLALGVLVGCIKDMLCWTGRGGRSFSQRAYTYMAVGMALNILTLLGIYLLRQALPWPFEAPLVGAAVGLALTGQLLSLRKARQAAHTPPQQQAPAEPDTEPDTEVK